MSNLTNLEEYTLRIFLKQLELNPSTRSFEPLVLSSASVAHKLLEEIGSLPMVQTQEEEELEVPRDEEQPEQAEPTLSDIEL